MMFILVCENASGDKCNVHGSKPDCGKVYGNECGSNSECKTGYFGDQCQYCTPDSAIISGANGTVDPLSGVGVLCGGKRP